MTAYSLVVLILEVLTSPWKVLTGSKGCFLTSIQVSQEAGKVVRYCHLFKNLPQFVAIHTVKVFSVVNEAEVDAFLELLWFLYDPMNVGGLISVSSAFSKPTCTSGNS